MIENLRPMSSEMKICFEYTNRLTVYQLTNCSLLHLWCHIKFDQSINTQELWIEFKWSYNSKIIKVFYVFRSKIPIFLLKKNWFLVGGSSRCIQTFPWSADNKIYLNETHLKIVLISNIFYVIPDVDIYLDNTKLKDFT